MHLISSYLLGNDIIMFVYHLEQCLKCGAVRKRLVILVESLDIFVLKSATCIIEKS